MDSAQWQETRSSAFAKAHDAHRQNDNVGDGQKHWPLIRILITSHGNSEQSASDLIG